MRWYQITALTVFFPLCVNAQSPVELKTITVNAAPPIPVIADNVIDARQAAMPVVIIDHKKITMMGSRRLDELLREQTGLAVVSDLGSGNRSVGLQMQGFSSEYITVLIDGQPMAGRNNGNFDLSRISISNIERIEIIKGASSSLYGSEALGGVVNIITRQTSTQPQAALSALYGTHNTVDAALNSETPFAQNKGTAFLSANYYRTDGFNVNPYLSKGSQTAPPYNSFTVQGRAKYKLNDISTLHVSGRFADRQSTMLRDYGAMPSKDELSETDVNGMLSLDNHFNNGLRLIGRYYLTRYTSSQEVQLIHSNQPLQSDEFTEYVHRMELQASREYKHLTLIGGAGSDYASTTGEVSGHMYNYFGYAQANYKPFKQLSIVAGLRYDGNNVYGGKLNPSAGVNYTPAKWITFRGAVGKGYKSPTYRQLYQVFTNVNQGYTVAGANIFSDAVKQLQAAGLVQQVWTIAGTIKNLEAETSTSYNAGITIKPASGLELSVNGFYNDIQHLINTQQVGIKTNGGQLFSYINIDRAFTKGIEASVSYQPLKGLTISGGYQLLYAKDKAVMDSIQSRSPRYDTVRSFPRLSASTPGDYFGLPNRSRHMANIQVFYELRRSGLAVSFRATYRGKYGFLDTDNNGFIDPFDVYVKGYVLMNATIQKKLCKDRLSLQLTVDNIGNYTDYLMPAQPGRMLLAGLSWRWFKQQK
jgi:outer membrane receptor for ferrienterochelin and colicins